MKNVVLQRLVQEREALLDTSDQILARAAQDERDPSESEMDLIKRNRARMDELEPSITELIEHEETRTRGAQVRASLMAGDPDPTPSNPASPPEGGPYQTFAQYARDALICRFDQIGAMVGPEMRTRAAARLERAAQVHTITSDVPGILPTQHLNEIFQVIDRARPIVQASRTVNLTSGKLTWPSITGKPTVAKQVTEKTNPAYGKMTVAMVETIADTFLGAGNLSWQTIQWSSPDALALFFDLMAESYADQTEAAAAADLIAGATAGPTVATNDLPGWTAAIAAAAGKVRNDSKAKSNGIALDPATGYRLLGLVSNANPVFISAGPGSLGEGTGNVGGLNFIMSDALPANTIIVGDFKKLLTAETAGAPVEMRAVEPSIGGLEVGVIGAFASAVALAGAFTKLTAPA
jgi:HK97 family phage major capsid protein